MPVTNSAPVIRSLWKPHPDRDARMASAVDLARWAATAEHLLAAHRRKLLSQAIWWYTECDGKFTARYRTAAVVGEGVVNVRHEHVVQRKGQIDRMLSAPDQVDQIMAGSLACLVSTAEHQLLAPFDHLDGWPRYRAAGLTVIDMADGSELQLGFSDDLGTALDGVFDPGSQVAVPDSKAPFWPDIANFALTYDGYGRHRGGVEETTEVHSLVLEEWRASTTSDRPLDDLRCALFMEQRIWKDPGPGPGEPTGEERDFVEFLLEAVREAAGGAVTVDPRSWSAGGGV